MLMIVFFTIYFDYDLHASFSQLIYIYIYIELITQNRGYITQ